jgi:hypothetical protein
LRPCFFIFFVFLLGGCSVLDEQEQQPAYIQVEEVTVNNPGGFGQTTHDITDLWSYLDGTNLGVYPYPTHIACLPQNDTVTVGFLAGIRQNGIASSVSIYPMLQPIEKRIVLQAGKEYLLNPVFSYREDVIKRFEAGFEGSSTLFEFDADLNSATQLKKDLSVKRSGDASGLIEVPDSLDFVEVASTEAYIGIPTNGNPVYLELDYLSTANVFIGLIGYQDADNLDQPLKSYYLGLKPSDIWKKIYVNLTEPVFQSDLAAYRVLIRAENRGTGAVEKVNLDNLKLLHF